MLIDTSVLLAIYNKEAGYEELLRFISKSERRWLSVASYVEFALVAKNSAWIDKVIQLSGIELVDLSKRAAEEAVKGFFRYGKGMKNRAQLNFGDCLVYGTAKAAGVNLLFKGQDFSHTDIPSAIIESEQ